jgi:hypothetical protein
MAKTSLALLTAALLICLPGAADADSQAPAEIAKCGEIDASRPVPPLAVRHALSEKQNPRLGDRNYDILLEIGDRGTLVLASYGTLPDKEIYAQRENAIARSAVYGDIVRAGWLLGAPDLLLLHWTDASGMGGTGHYLVAWYSLVRVTDGELQELLRYSVLRSANSRHAYYGTGLGSCRFWFDAPSASCHLRASFFKEAYSHTPRPLHRRYVDKCDEARYCGVLREEVTASWHYSAGELQPESVVLIYRTQESDYFRDVANFYLGPLAPPSVIADANRGLEASYPGPFGNPPTAGFPADVRLMIPLPAEWIAAHYGLGKCLFSGAGQAP